jgi:chromosome partitioning protein
MVISLVNQKGGTGKTTSAVNLGSALALMGHKVLLLDLDPQGSLSFSLGIHKPACSVIDVFLKKTLLPASVVCKENMDVVPADLTLADLELGLARSAKREYKLKNILDGVQGYDYILIDCPPSLSLLTVNALNASERVIIPMQMEVLSLKGLENILLTLDRTKKAFNLDMKVLRVLPVMVDIRKNLNDEVKQYIRQNFDIPIFTSCIRTNVKASEAPSFGKSVVSYAPRSNSAQDYISLANEIIHLN